MSALICPYIACLRYFGANTMWYLQFHRVCARLSISSFFFITDIPPSVLEIWSANLLLLYRWRLICSTHRLSLFGATGIARGCRFTRQKQGRRSCAALIFRFRIRLEELQPLPGRRLFPDAPRIFQRAVLLYILSYWKAWFRCHGRGDGRNLRQESAGKMRREQSSQPLLSDWIQASAGKGRPLGGLFHIPNAMFAPMVLTDRMVLSPLPLLVPGRVPPVCGCGRCWYPPRQPE